MQVLNYLQIYFTAILKRSGKSREDIREMMGHSTSQVTKHYVASLDMDKTCEINKGLLYTYEL